MLKAYLNPYGTMQQVGVKITPAPTNRSVTGYGNRIPTQYMVLVGTRFRRVYAVCYSNCATLYIGPVKDKTLVRIDNFAD